MPCGTVIADSAWPDPNVTGTAVVIIGKQDYVPAGSEYIMIVPLPGFNTSGISDVLVKFKLSVNGLILDVVLWLPDITDKISLGPNTSPVASADGKYWMEISYVQNGKEYVTSGPRFVIRQYDRCFVSAVPFAVRGCVSAAVVLPVLCSFEFNL